MNRRIIARHAALAAALGPVVVFFFFHLSSSMDHRITVVPDDGFYYLLLGKNFAEHHVWSFDGVTPTSGFHLLQGYVCALAAFVLPGAGTEALLDVLGFVGLGVTVLAVFVLVRTFARALSPAAALGVAFVSGSANFVQQPVSVMEWPWVVLASTLLVAAILEDRPGLAFAAGCLGAFGRTDFPLLAAVAVGASVVLRPREGYFPHARAVCFGLAGAVVALGLALLHNRLATGEFLQSSAMIKAHWGSVRGYKPLLGAEIAVWTSAPGEALRRGLAFVLAAHALSAGALALVERGAPTPPTPEAAPTPPTREPAPAADDDRRRANRRFLTIFGVLCTVAFAAFYATGSASIQAWYTAPFVVPIAGLYAAGLDLLRRRESILLGNIALGATLAVNGWLATCEGMAEQTWTLRGAEWLGQNRPAGRIGAWNAGIISAFSTRDVINLDGLVNNAVTPYILGDRLHCYLLDAPIDYVFDWETMLDDRYARMGGYSSGLLERALVPQHVIEGTEHPLGGWRRLTLFKVDRAVLEASGGCPIGPR
jgi:hypothetical protein